jgi:spermidine/putrescine transport system permease protein
VAIASITRANKDAKSRVTYSRVGLILVAPALAYLGLFFITPFVLLIMTSLGQQSTSGLNQTFSFGLNFANYLPLVTDNLENVLRSFGYALIASIGALLIGYPLAYFIGVKMRHRPMLQRMLITLVIAPFFISFLLRTLAWSQIFSNSGPLLGFLQDVGIMGSGDRLLGTPFAVVFGLIYNFVPFMTLPLYTTLEKLDIRYLEAGSDLYASPSRVFTKVTLPLSMPGVISGTLLTFIPMAGDYVNASKNYLGGAQTSMLGNIIEAEYKNFNYPVASALSVGLMALILILITLYVRKVGSEDLL